MRFKIIAILAIVFSVSIGKAVSWQCNELSFNSPEKKLSEDYRVQQNILLPQLKAKLLQPEAELFKGFIHLSNFVKGWGRLHSWSSNFEFYRFRTKSKGTDINNELPVKTMFSDYGHLFNKNSILNKSVLIAKAEVFEAANYMLKLLYQSYSMQGDERNSNINQYSTEDRDSEDRITHFLVAGEGGEMLSHIQAQYAMREPGQFNLLNLEKHFPEAHNFIWQDGDQIVIELGRYHILKSQQLKGLANQDLLSKSLGRELIFAETWLRITNWLVETAPQIPVVFQVNSAVFKVINSKFKPLDLSNRILVKQKADMPEEWIVRLNPDQILELRRIVFRTKIQNMLKLFLESSPQGTQYLFNQLSFSVEVNERDLYERLGIYKLSEKFATKEQESQHGKGYYLPVRFREENLSKKHMLRLGREEALELQQMISEN